jgi:hypothetical protein
MVSLYDIDQRTGTQRWNFTTQGAGYARPPPWPEAWSRTERMPDDGFIYSNHGFSSIEELEVPCGNGFVRLNDQTNKVERAHGDATGVVPAVPDPGGLQRHDRGRG